MGCPVREGAEDGRGRGAARRSRPRGRRRARGGRGLGAAGHGEAALRDASRATRSGVDLAVRLVAEAGVAAIALHPRRAKQFHHGRPDYELVGELRRAARARRSRGAGDRLRRACGRPGSRARAYEESGADAVMIARGSLGNPWIFEELTGGRADEPTDERDRAPSCCGRIDRAERALGARARGAQPAQVLPLVRRAAWLSRAPRRTRSSGRRASTRFARLLAARAFSGARLQRFLAAQTPRYNRRALPGPRAPECAAFRAFLSPGSRSDAFRDEQTEEEVSTVARESLITQEGLEKLKAEIDHLTTTKRREVAARIKEAREFGDIAENSEYDDAKNEQALLEQRIAQLEERLRRANVVDEKQHQHREGRRRRHRPRQGPEVGRLAQVPDRRPGRGQPGREQALERVADRQGPAGPQAQRRRHRRRSARPEEEAQDHQDRSRVELRSMVLI